MGKDKVLLPQFLQCFCHSMVLAVLVVTLILTCYTVTGAAVSGDFDQDGDVDGEDLSRLVNAPSILPVETFADLYGMISSLSYIPSDRRIDWEPGIQGAIRYYPAAVNARDYGAAGDGVTDDTAAIKNAIADAEEGEAVLLPAGRYRLTSKVEIDKGIVLRGEGYEKTFLDCHHDNTIIEIEGDGRGSTISAVSGFSKGSNSIVIADASGFSVGDILEIQQDNDPDYFQPGREGYQSWQDNHTGQQLKITAISGNTITTEHPFYHNYNSNMNPRVYRRRDFVRGAGVESLTIERVTYSDSGSTIRLSSAYNCWVRNCNLKYGAGSVVGLKRSFGCEIRENFFDNTWVSGDGGEGYGASLSRSTDNLIENNIFSRFRHSMIVQMGSCGNVFGYNYSREPMRNGESAADNPNVYPNADISVHGSYGHQNLFESNTVQYIKDDNVWGTNGPTTFLRNRVEHLLMGRVKEYVWLYENNPYHNYLGFELGVSTNPDSYSSNPLRLDDESASTLINHGYYLYQDGTLTWDPNIEDHNLPDSYYLTSKPPFYDGATPWPTLGGDLAPNTNIIPAQQRYNNGNFIPALID